MRLQLLQECQRSRWRGQHQVCSCHISTCLQRGEREGACDPPPPHHAEYSSVKFSANFCECQRCCVTKTAFRAKTFWVNYYSRIEMNSNQPPSLTPSVPNYCSRLWYTMELTAPLSLLSRKQNVPAKINHHQKPPPRGKYTRIGKDMGVGQGGVIQPWKFVPPDYMRPCRRATNPCKNR